MVRIEIMKRKSFNQMIHALHLDMILLFESSYCYTQILITPFRNTLIFQIQNMNLSLMRDTTVTPLELVYNFMCLFEIHVFIVLVIEYLFIYANILNLLVEIELHPSLFCVCSCLQKNELQGCTKQSSLFFG